MKKPIIWMCYDCEATYFSKDLIDPANCPKCGKKAKIVIVTRRPECVIYTATT